MKKLLFVLVLLILAPTICLSEEYSLLEGKNNEVCEAYHKNLNSLTDSVGTIACERRFQEDNPDLKGIDWQSTYAPDPISGHMTIINPDIWDKILSFVVPSRYPMGRCVFRGYEIRKAKIDIDNDGIIEAVYRVEIYLCRSSKYYATYLVVFDEKKNEIDIKRTEKILKSAMQEGVISAFVMYDAFTYKGKTYFDMWDEGGFENDPKTLTVYLFENNHVQKICTCQYNKP